MQDRRNPSLNWLGCLVCGIDSGPVVTFFLWLVGAGMLALFSFIAWAWFRGHMSFAEEPSDLCLRAEGLDHEP
jgi:hypothetical protein